MVRRRIGGAVLVVAASLASLAGVACTASTSAKVAGNDSNTGGSPDGSVSSDDSIGSTESQDASDEGADAGSSCQTGGLPTDTYVAGLQKIGKVASGDPSDAGSFAGLTFTLESNEIGDAASPPAEPYTNAFTLKLTDPSGAPVTDATVLLPTNDQAVGWPWSKDPWMPLHGHGSSITPTITNNMDGTYTLSVYFFMPGLWRIYIVAETEAGAPQSAMYSFCLQ